MKRPRGRPPINKPTFTFAVKIRETHRDKLEGLLDTHGGRRGECFERLLDFALDNWDMWEEFQREES